MYKRQKPRSPGQSGATGEISESAEYAEFITTCEKFESLSRSDQHLIRYLAKVLRGQVFSTDRCASYAEVAYARSKIEISPLLYGTDDIRLLRLMKPVTLEQLTFKGKSAPRNLEALQGLRIKVLRIEATFNVTEPVVIPELDRMINLAINPELTALSTLNIKFVGTTWAHRADLRLLHIQNGDLDDISFIAHQIELRELYLTRNRVHDLKPLEDLLSLERLSMYRNQVSDIRPLAGLPNLESIILTKNKLDPRAISLVALPNLKELFVGDANITDISPIARLPLLRHFHAPDNNISSLRALSGTNLEYLEVAGNQIENMDVITKIEHLKHLDFSRNPVHSLPDLSDHLSLERIEASETEIDVCDAIKAPNLNYLRAPDQTIYIEGDFSGAGCD